MTRTCTWARRPPTILYMEARLDSKVSRVSVWDRESSPFHNRPLCYFNFSACDIKRYLYTHFISLFKVLLNFNLAALAPYTSVTSLSRNVCRFADCRPVQIWMLAAHGTRCPTLNEINEINSLTDIKEQILHNHEARGGKCFTERSDLFIYNFSLVSCLSHITKFSLGITLFFVYVN